MEPQRTLLSVSYPGASGILLCPLRWAVNPIVKSVLLRRESLTVAASIVDSYTEVIAP